ncbi:MAG: hypothetical protein AABX11_02190, partial [Nanoarchaeota archaeon]
RSPDSALAIIINHQDHKPQDFGFFIYPVGSDEFNHLTGTNNTPDHYPVDRVYVGVSDSGGREMAKHTDDLRAGKISLEWFDKELVLSYFLRPEQAPKPNQITFKLTEGGIYTAQFEQ